MPDEVLDGLRINPEGVYVDGTLGGGGHASLILHMLKKGGKLIGIDQDQDALNAAQMRLSSVSTDAEFVTIKGNFHDIKTLLASAGVDKIDGCLLDLGVSSYQLDTPERGFSYRFDGPLDMRMDSSKAISAYHLVNETDEKTLANIIYQFGDEKKSRKIATAIVNARKKAPIETTLALSGIIEKVMPRIGRNAPHPAMRTFMALRIAVNDELAPLERAVYDIMHLMRDGGRLAVITFHSLEDRIIKNTLRHLASPCECPRDLPYCVCGAIPLLKIINNKPITPSENELKLNTRSHSAKLRIAERIL